MKCLYKADFCLFLANRLSWKERECVGNRHTPHIQRKSQHFLCSFPLLSPGCFPILPTSLPLRLPVHSLLPAIYLTVSSYLANLCSCSLWIYINLVFLVNCQSLSNPVPPSKRTGLLISFLCGKCISLSLLNL